MQVASFPFFGVVVDVVLHTSEILVGAEDAVPESALPFHRVAQAVCMFAHG